MHTAGFLSSIFLLLGLVGAQFSEGGGNAAWVRNPQKALEPEQQQLPLTGIVDELKALRNLQQQYDADQLYSAGQIDSFEQQQQQPQYFDNEEGTNPEELANIGADIQKLIKQQEDEDLSGQLEQQPVEEQPAAKAESKPVDQQKRGQFEFVEFVEPHAKALKNVEFMDKRAPVSEFSQDGARYMYNSNNVLFIVAVTVGSVFVVVGVVGGVYHVNNIRKQRNDAFDDFTRYSPAGPGRDVLRRGRGFAGSPITDVGDSELAKAAHLHHYEQTKQKIIGSDNGINNDDQSDKSDDEAEDLEEHNFSIYECPGLAMSGDIEVKNPTFEQQHP